MALFSQLGNYKNFGLLVMRAGLGIMMFMHGLPKLTGGITTWTELGRDMSLLHIDFLPAFWGFMCAVTECIGGLFCVLGLWFRLVCILLLINFIVASMSHLHGGESVMKSSHAIELCFVFFGLIFIGAGDWSIDKS